MTTDKTPTDAEILDVAEDFRSQYKHGGTTFDDFDALAFARAVLAKWGSPVVAGEPWGASVGDRVWVGKLPTHVPKLAEEEGLPIQWLYTTPQPTQAQAGAVPLTRDEALDAFCHTPGIHQFVQAFMAGVRFAEQHHGIKGGQHE